VDRRPVIGTPSRHRKVLSARGSQKACEGALKVLEGRNMPDYSISLGVEGWATLPESERAKMQQRYTVSPVTGIVLAQAVDTAKRQVMAEIRNAGVKGRIRLIVTNKTRLP
jgi:hypothetical protein